MSAARQLTTKQRIDALVESVEARKKLSAIERAKQAWKAPVKVWHKCEADEKALLELAWRRGELSYKLTPSQAEVYQLILDWERRPVEETGFIWCLDISRRWGKSNLLITKAFEIAIRRPNARIVYVAPLAKEVKRILLPLIRKDILPDCPPSLAPSYVKSEMEFVFPNGAVIQLVGLDLNPDKARGAYADAVFLDECGFFDKLAYLIFSVLQPQLLGRPGARIYCASTPPATPGHFWSSDLIPLAISRGAHAARYLTDASQYTDEEKLAFIDSSLGGREGTQCRREYFVEHITDDELAILIEFRDAEPYVVTDDFKIPEWRDCYTIMDPGFNDLAAVLFCYWDFENQRIVVEDEYGKSRENSRGVAEGIKKKERELWAGQMRKGPGYSLLPQPYMRYSDNDPRLIYDLMTEHDLAFVGVQKKSLELMVNAVRVAISQQPPKIIIHPRCERLVKHCRNGVWKNRTVKNPIFARPGGEFGHYDFLAALVYAQLSIQTYRNPIPPMQRIVGGDLKLKGQYEGQKPRSRWAHQPLFQAGRRR